MPSTASCIARSRRPIRRRAQSRRRSWSASCRDACPDHPARPGAVMSADEAFRFKLSDAQRRIVATVRELTQAELKPRGLKYMDGTFPWENIRSLAQLGILGMAVPEAYGGAAFGV